MPATIDYYFISSSPFVYLGHTLLHEIAARHGARVVCKPVDIASVWEVSGSVPLGQRSPTRRRYRLIELQRIAEFRRLPINPEPKHFPVDPALADRLAIALAERGENPAGFIARVTSGLWAREEDIADPATLAAHLEAEGFEPAPLIIEAGAAIVASIRRRNTEDAVAADAIGVPVYVLNGEPFWGQDRLELLDRALASGRAPYRA